MNSQTADNILPERLKPLIPTVFKLLSDLADNRMLDRALCLDSLRGRLLDPSRLLNSACAHTGLADWGGEDFNKALHTLVTTVRTEPSLSTIGAFSHATNLNRIVRNRLYLIEALKRYPAIATQAVRAPVMVTGIARSGTTYLHALLSAHTQARAPKCFEALFTRNPLRLDAKEAQDERIAKTQSFLRKLRFFSPHILEMHRMACHKAEECYFLFEPSGLSWQYPMTGELSQYQRWLTQQSLAPVYQHYAQQLRYLQWQNRDSFADDNLFWCLKSPFHLFALKELLGLYPDMKVVVIHRDIIDTMASWLTLVGFVRHIHHRRVCYRSIGREALVYWRCALDRMLDVYRSHPGNFIHVRYDDLITDPAGVSARVYSACGRSSEGLATVAAASSGRDRKASRAKKKPYDISWFGLNEDSIRQSLADYLDFTHQADFI
ncbi:MAG: sulfotransferase [Gammaproteobacteria bacterium]|nr:sulfotransferase [Gammaproteobacteria bacterium]